MFQIMVLTTYFASILDNQKFGCYMITQLQFPVEILVLRLLIFQLYNNAYKIMQDRLHSLLFIFIDNI